MSYVILGHCCKDGSCLQVCPQNCIHPAPGEPSFATVEHLYIDPATCIDCSACADACPAQAIKPEAALTETEQVYAQKSSTYFDLLATTRPPRTSTPAIPIALRSSSFRVAVVGAGSAAMYTVRELLQRSTSVQITVYEQSPHLGGLLRTAVSPDHRGIRQMMRLFDIPFADPRVQTRFDTRVGVEVTMEFLRSRYDAVVLAYGAARPREITAPAAADVHQAIDALTSAHAAHAAGSGPIRLVAGPTVMIIGGGNVAFDVAMSIAKQRILTQSGAPITRVVIVARSPASRPSFTFSALYELSQHDVDIAVDTGGTPISDVAADPLVRRLAAIARDGGALARSAPLSVELVFGREVIALTTADGGIRLRTEQVAAGGRVRLTTVAAEDLSADSVIMASGFVCEPMPGVPLGADGAVHNHQGRVVSPVSGETVEGLYVVGWAKRGGRGGVGENRRCAAQTVNMMVADRGAI
ncbi:ferredoxin [Nocardia neocaledoniensis NBRC 108232]|uniref:ferredoxin--NADP(+) reductase n=1 Tax=Nocardia neocaledoniensis TaxID=236511 RepID=A0A317NIK7_9NOCA|nr:FAD-dependent oxidoreductase [Nocardia neocaledoniensis]PWV74935.1 ferredoxin--NADP+ reductase [Nocardia neocaledoniensis]GEM35208.1 ferredoxin [Nocardia neocaledoniensis NBRC 108232]